MLSYKSGQGAPPMYDYYVETDLDDFDQLVDYSKKYTDQDSYEVRKQIKSPKVLIHFPSNPGAQPAKQQSCNDELKVYYMEGTPLTISSSSSLCDLRDIGVNTLISSKHDVKKNENSSFTPLGDAASLRESFASKKEGDVLITNTSSEKGKEDITCKEGKNVTFRNEDNISKASSPLMFSRSSSICSLNSFEQQSLVDDRSSISIFSTLTSGIISPSELPDSPGEAVSPSHLQKDVPTRAISPILKSDADILKDESDNESVNVLEDSILSNISDEDGSKSKEVDNPESRTLQSGLQQLNYNNHYKSDDELDSEEDNALIQQCIELGMSQDDGKKLNTESSIIKCESPSDTEPIASLQQQCKVLEETDLCMEAQDEHKKQNTSLSEDTSDSDEDDILVNQCIQLGMPQQSSKAVENPHFVKLQPLNNGVKEDVREYFADGISDDDDDDDDLLESCIRAGMPSPKEPAKFLESTSNIPKRNSAENPETSNQLYKADARNDCIKKYCNEGSPENHTYATVNKIWSANSSFNQDGHLLSSNSINTSPKQNFLNPSKFIDKQSMRDNCPDGISDDDDDLIENCIRAGMPNTVTSKCLHKRPAASSNVELPKKIQNSKQQYVSEMRNDSVKKYCNARLPQGPIYSPIHNNTAWISGSSLIEVDSMRVYQTEDTPILSPSASISDLSSLSFNDDKSCHDSFLNNSRNSDCSSESEDDEILIQCIRSGMPSSRRTGT
ncbi:adenomatous polyposis coli protein-like [Uloborus diversus]|uniref:adenomatous polyposis coli protein-like n=1 Tax=Uloborus diversus TaxID=327109 RepID=UPI002409F5BF|nr:adenomatous polyposis coli protein-like [Uloborus diversus]